MLQQTRVETVIPYWLRWMKEFPNVETLAKATPDDVNKLWAGLGYYRRAQMLLKGAKWVVEENKGMIPKDVDDLLQIPGIGPYTAGAISSIAFGSVSPIVDGNIIRVISRLLASKFVTGTKEMDQLCWGVARTLVDVDDPGSFNQAMMELGAIICKPTSPDCDICPLNELCVARKLINKSTALSSQKESSKVDLLKKRKRKTEDLEVLEDGLPSDLSYFPRRPIKKKAAEIKFTVKVFYFLKHVDKKPSVYYLFVRREATGLLANQWEFPSVAIGDESKSDASETKEIPPDLDDNSNFSEYLMREFGIRWHSTDRMERSSDGDASYDLRLDDEVDTQYVSEPLVHIFSHQKHFMHIHLHKVRESPDNSSESMTTTTYREFKWMTAAEIKENGITSGCQKVLVAAEKLISPKAAKEKKTSSNILQYFQKSD